MKLDDCILIIENKLKRFKAEMEESQKQQTLDSIVPDELSEEEWFEQFEWYLQDNPEQEPDSLPGADTIFGDSN